MCSCARSPALRLLPSHIGSHGPRFALLLAFLLASSTDTLRGVPAATEMALLPAPHLLFAIVALLFLARPAPLASSSASGLF